MISGELFGTRKWHLVFVTILLFLYILPSFPYRTYNHLNIWRDRKLWGSTEVGAKTSTTSSKQQIARCIPPEIDEIEDLYVKNMMQYLQLVNVVVSETVSNVPIPTMNGFYAKEEERKNTKSLPIVMIHGFDSSCLEYRRLAPKLAKYHDVYVPDILGWGFSDISNVKDFSPKAKLEHLKAYLQQVVKQKCVLVGASLGGGIAINLAAEVCPELVEDVVLIDAQVST